MPNVTEPPFIIHHPLIRLGDTGAFVEIQCGASSLDVNVEQDENTIETFCGVFRSYKAQRWTITVTIGQSYGTEGSWTLIHPMVDTIVPFAITPDTGTASVDNPVMSGNALVKAFPFISAAPGEASEVDLVLSVQGDPTFSTTLPTGAASEAA